MFSVQCLISAYEYKREDWGDEIGILVQFRTCSIVHIVWTNEMRQKCPDFRSIVWIKLQKCSILHIIVVIFLNFASVPPGTQETMKQILRAV